MYEEEGQGYGCWNPKLTSRKCLLENRKRIKIKYGFLEVSITYLNATLSCPKSKF